MKTLTFYDDNDESRFVKAPERGEGRSEWRRDYGRVVHSPSFRRLQGKAQLFPGGGWNSRNRLTHSIEVAQVAKNIAQKLNKELERQSYEVKINEDIVEIAGLVHDIGHPPFGHNGERALNECMKETGGFEGNAQTLRILARLEKKERSKKAVNLNAFDEKGDDVRVGLNLTRRVLASVLKYDREIPNTGIKDVIKGYYSSEADIVRIIKSSVYKGKEYSEYLRQPSVTGSWKTIECQIMDIADDIAYSTYDLEDAFKLGLLNPLDLLEVDRARQETIREELDLSIEEGKELGSLLYDIAEEALQVIDEELKKSLGKEPDEISDTEDDQDPQAQQYYQQYYRRFRYSAANEAARKFAQDGYLRIEYTSKLAGSFIDAIKIEVNEDFPPFSRVYLEPRARKKVEALKKFNFISVVESPRIRVPEYRGYHIVSEIYEALLGKDKKMEGTQLLPGDIRKQYDYFDEKQKSAAKSAANKDEEDDMRRRKTRVIADFIAGMTDAYAVEFHDRLYSDNPETIFDPFQ